MIKKVLTKRKIFLFTIIFSVFTSSICTYALKADWTTVYRYFMMYKDENGNYVRDKWMTLDIDFDGLLEWVNFTSNGVLCQWTEKQYTREEVEVRGQNREPEDRLGPPSDYPEDASLAIDGFNWWYYFQNGHVTVGDPTEKLRYKINPIGQWVDDNGVIQRP